MLQGIELIISYAVNILEIPMNKTFVLTIALFLICVVLELNAMEFVNVRTQMVVRVVEKLSILMT